MSLSAKLFTVFTTCLICTSFTRADNLAEIYNLAVQNDSGMKIAKAHYRAGKELSVQAKAPLMPVVGLQANTGKTGYSGSTNSFDADSFRNSNNPTLVALADPIEKLASGSISEGNVHSYSATVTQTVFSLEKWYNYQGGKENDNTIEAALHISEQDLILNVAVAYFNVLRGIDNFATAKAEEKTIQRQLEQTQQRFDVGLIAITEVLEARAVFDSVAVARLEVEGALAIFYESLEVLTGQPHHNLDSLSENFPIIIPEPIDREGWVKLALENSIEIQTTRHAVEVANDNAKAKKFASYPTLDASASYNHSSKGVDASLYQLSMNVPLYTGGYSSSAKRQAYEQVNEAQEKLTSAQRQIVQQTRAAFLSVSTDVSKVKARQLAITSRKSALDATQAGYEVGTRNVVDVLAAQTELYQALRNYSNARYDYVINLLKLKKAAGTLNPNDIEMINSGLTKENVSPLAKVSF